MNTKSIGVIGGSGLYQMESFELLEKKEVITPFGKPSGPLLIGQFAGQNLVFLARHGEGHVLNPSEINFRANIWALKSVGVSAIFSVSAVGSLKEEIAPGHMVIVDQFFDRTRMRASTFFENGIVAHVSFAKPVSDYLRSLLIAACEKLQVTYHPKGTYVCMEGPQFSTIAESESYRHMGAHVVGMTNLQEAKLAREAEIDYATLALSTDYDCWHPHHDSVTTAQVIAVMKANVAAAQKILFEAIQGFDVNRSLESENALRNAIMTDRRYVKSETVEKLKPILAKYF